MVVEDEDSPPPDPADSPVTVTVIPVDERLSRGASVTEALEQVAGVNVLQLGGLGDFAAVGIRGSSLRQVQVFLDGVPLNPDGQQVVNLAEFPLAALERVEVYRGGAPVAFAAAPIGGVVNLVTREEATRPVGQVVVGQHETARIMAVGGGDGEVGRVPVDALVFLDGFSTAGDFVYFTDNGTIYNVMDDDRLRRANNHKAQLSANARVRIGPRGRRLTLVDHFLHREEGLPGHTNSPTQATGLETLRNLSVAQLDARRGPVGGTGRLWLQRRTETFDDRDGEIGTGVQWARSVFTSGGLLAHGEWGLNPHLVPGVAVALRRDASVTTDLLADRESGRRVRHSGTLAASVDVFGWRERLRVTPVVQGVVLDNRSLGDDQGQDTPVAPQAQDVALAFTPRLGLRLRPVDPLTLKASGGRFLRAPDMTELFGDRGAIIGNPDLRPESGWHGDVGAVVRAPDNPVVNGGVDVSHFWLGVRDHIIFVQNSQRTSVPVNFGQTWTQGLEVALDLSILGAVDSRTSYTGTLSRNLVARPEVANNQLPRVPARQAAQSTSVYWESWVRIGHTWTYTADNYWDATNFYRAPPRSLHSAFARSTPAPALGLELELSVLNLMDRTVDVVPRNPLNPGDAGRIVQPITDFIGYPLPGRTWLASLRWTG